MFWGISPALDLQEEYLKHCDNDTYELNFLVIGGCDARHILKTLAQAHRHSRRNINLFVVDGCPELVARQILLISIAMERTDHVGLLEKTRRFIEIYGNMLLRPATSRYMVAKARQLVGMITNLDLMKHLLPSMSIEQMKYRDRDYMENLLNFWMTGNTNQFDACGLWGQRVRHSLGVRYDTRAGVFDWDYHMRLKEIARQICSNEYKHYREHGIAFTWLETEVCRPNNTLAAGVFRCGERFLHRGYLGDIVTGPFVTYGLDCEDQDMLKSSNGVNFKRATDLVERNVMRIMYELEQQKRFDVKLLPDTDKNLGMIVLSELDARMSMSVQEAPLLLRENRETYIDVDFGKVHFLSLSALEHYPHKPEFKKIFHSMFLGHNILSRVRPSVFDMLRDDGLVVFETRKYLVELQRQDVKAFGDQIRELATAAQCSQLVDFDPQRDDFAKYVIKRENAEYKHDVKAPDDISNMIKREDYKHDIKGFKDISNITKSEDAEYKHDIKAPEDISNMIKREDAGYKHDIKGPEDISNMIKREDAGYKHDIKGPEDISNITKSEDAEYKHDIKAPEDISNMIKWEDAGYKYDIKAAEDISNMIKREDAEYKHVIKAPEDISNMIKREDAGYFDINAPEDISNMIKREDVEYKHDINAPEDISNMIKREDAEYKHDIMAPEDISNMIKREDAEYKHDIMAPEDISNMIKREDAGYKHDIMAPEDISNMIKREDAGYKYDIKAPEDISNTVERQNE